MRGMQEFSISDGTTTSEIAALKREILGLRDTAIGAQATAANAEWRLELANRRIKHLESLVEHRKQLLNSWTWKVGSLVMLIFWPLRKLKSLISR